MGESLGLPAVNWTHFLTCSESYRKLAISGVATELGLRQHVTVKLPLFILTTMFELFTDSVSPFADKLKTNYTPSSEEMKFLRDVLATPTERLSQIQGQIEVLDLVIGQLKAEQYSIQSVIDPHKALMSPMRRIPDDILREIFLACLPTEHVATIDNREAPLLLARICRRWRALAHSIPLLWASIHIPPLQSNLLPKLRPVIEQWLERSGARPLKIDVFEDSLYESHSISMVQTVSPRLHHLVLQADLQVVLPILRLDSKSLPLLEGIHLFSRGMLPSTGDGDEINLFRVPSLTDVALIGVVVAGGPLSLPLQWGKLTNLELRSFQEGALNGSDALEVLRRCVNLRRCYFELNDPDSSISSNTSLITLPHLHTLIFTGYFQFSRRIPDLVIPKLRLLKIGYDAQTSWFANFPEISYGSDTLVAAALDTTCFTQTGLLDFLQSFPRISHLHLSSNGRNETSMALDDGFLLNLSSAHDSCPMLTHVRITPAVFCDTNALAFIEARMVMPTPLKRFEAQFLRPMPEDAMPMLQQFISKGKPEVRLEYRRFDPKAGLLGRIG
ncbi:hypothetical protein C8R45DRAFT_1030705 [Mycena sanguinolenta]|nr:hypothetical protein C8R45DRAFT_1030705 [Mycena sanguinolenta]